MVEAPPAYEGTPEPEPQESQAAPLRKLVEARRDAKLEELQRAVAAFMGDDDERARAELPLRVASTIIALRNGRGPARS